jgi:hypothetical protein
MRSLSAHRLEQTLSGKIKRIVNQGRDAWIEIIFLFESFKPGDQ